MLRVLVIVALLPTAAACIEESANRPPTFTDEQRRSLFRPGPVWDGSATAPDRLTREQMVAYTDGPAFWLGEQYLGYNLRAPLLSTVPSPIAGDVAVTFLYGFYCTAAESLDQCGGAVDVSTSSGCVPRADQFTPGDGRKVETMRGAAVLVQEKRGTMYLWTGGVRITLHVTVDTKQGRRAVDDLRGIGRVSGHIGPGDPLPPPDFSRC